MKILTIDIGGTSIKTAVAIIDKTMIKLATRNTTMVDKTNVKSSLIRALNNYNNANFDYVAISATGIISDGIVVATNGKLGNYELLNLEKLVFDEFQKQVVICNDVNAISYAEKPNLNSDEIHLIIALGTGIGGALIYKDKVLSGSTGAFAEIGQLKINGKTFEELASTNALVEIANKKYNLKIASGIEFFKLLESNHKAQICLEEWLDNLALGLEQLLYVYNPNTIILAGAVSMQHNLIIPGLQTRLSSLNQVYVKNLTIKVAREFNDAGLIGAVEKLRSEIC